MEKLPARGQMLPPAPVLETKAADGIDGPAVVLDVHQKEPLVGFMPLDEGGYILARENKAPVHRLALGARSAHLLWLVVGKGLRLALVGAALGMGGAFGLTRLLETLLFGVKATDPLIFAGAALALSIAAIAACYIPARRAMKVDPLNALRHE